MLTFIMKSGFPLPTSFHFAIILFAHRYIIADPVLCWEITFTLSMCERDKVCERDTSGWIISHLSFVPPPKKKSRGYQGTNNSPFTCCTSTIIIVFPIIVIPIVCSQFITTFDFLDHSECYWILACGYKLGVKGSINPCMSYCMCVHVLTLQFASQSCYMERAKV